MLKDQILTNFLKSIIIPNDIILIILSFDNRFAIRNGKIMNRIDFSKNQFRNLNDMFSILSFAYYCSNDELEEDIVIELPINDTKIYIIQCSLFQYKNDIREVDKFLSIKHLDDRVDEEKILTIY